MMETRDSENRLVCKNDPPSRLYKHRLLKDNILLSGPMKNKDPAIKKRTGREETKTSRRDQTLWQPSISASRSIFLTYIGIFILILSILKGNEILEIFQRRKQDGTLEKIDSEKTTICIAAVAHNREQTLLKSLQSWLSIKSIDRIYICDWGSQSPLQSQIRKKWNVSHIVLYRVEEERFVLSWAYNFLIGKMDECEWILKVDADVSLMPNFLNNVLLQEGTFFTGWHGWGGNDTHLNGNLLVRKTHFESVGGYNEHIQHYGFDDEDLYTRLEHAGYVRQHLPRNLMEHHWHAINFDGKNRDDPSEYEFEKFWTFLHQFMCGYTLPWSTEDTRTYFQVISGKTFSIAKRALSFEDVVGTGTYQILLVRFFQTLARSNGYAKLDEASLFALMIEYKPSTQSLFEVLRIDLDVKVAGKSGILAVQLYHGLGNRLRALLSAHVIASRTNRFLRVVNVPDHHFNASIHDIIDTSGFKHMWYSDTKNDFEVKFFKYFVYDLVEARDHEQFIPDSPNLFIKTAYRLNMIGADYAMEKNASQSLLPSASVRDHMAKIEKCDMSIHIRSRSAKDEFPVGGASEYSQRDLSLIELNRKNSEASKFCKQIKALSPRICMFIATDTRHNVDILKQCADFKIVHYDPLGCINQTHVPRAKECLEIAMADAFIASGARHFTGSPWSSFSELIMSMMDDSGSSNIINAVAIPDVH